MEGNLSNQESDIHPSVLIVDDISENLQLLGNILDDHDIEFSYATSGKEALDAVSFNRPDLILLDVNMPGMSGYEVCEILKRNPDTKDIPVIFLTAQADQEDVNKGLSIGGIDYITKPFNSKELVSRVNSHLELSISKQIITSKNEQLKSLNSELHDAIASKDKIFSIIAHDLKDPFNTLIGFSDLLLNTMDNREPEEVREFIRLIYESSISGLELLTNLLDWSRSQTGKINYKPEKIELSEVVFTVINLLKNTAEKKGIELVTDTESNLLVWADKKMIGTVLRNLVSNALKFTRQGGRVGIHAKQMDESVEITIMDTGVGIPKEKLDSLFNIDENFTTPGTNNEKGTGLGLVLCKDFIEKNGGRIRVKSEPDMGSEFIFTLPVSE